MFITGVIEFGESGKLEVDGIEVFDGEGCYLDNVWGHVHYEEFEGWLFMPVTGGYRNVLGETISFEPEDEEQYEEWKRNRSEEDDL